MEVENTDFVGGSLRISTAVLARIAKLAALEAMGVQQVRSATPEVKALLGRNGFARSVAVSMQEGVAEITVGIVVLYGHKIPAVCSKVQENVKNAVQNMTNVTVSRVNLVIAGLAAEGYTTVKEIGYIQRGYE